MGLVLLPERFPGTRHKTARSWGARFVIFIIFLFALASMGVTTVHADGDAPSPESIVEVNEVPKDTEALQPADETQQVDSSEPGAIVETLENPQTGEEQQSNAEEIPTEVSEIEPLLEEEDQEVEPASQENAPPESDAKTTVGEETLPIIDISEETVASEDGDLVVDDISLVGVEQSVSVDEPVSHPYFFVDETQHSFLSEGGNCAGQEHCQVSATPIQDVLDAVSGGLIPDDHTIYIGGGDYSEDIRIDSFENLILQGTANQRPSIFTGSITITNSNNITLRDLLIEGMISIRDSADVSIGENIELMGSVESLQAELSGGNLLIGEGQVGHVGGSLWLKGENVTVDGDITADEIYVQSEDTTFVSGKLSAPGGTVHILGERVALIEDTCVDVSGQDGGGTVLVGGDYKGQGTVPNAQQAYVGPDAVIKAVDALEQAIAAEPTECTARFNLGLSLLAAKQADASSQAYDAALDCLQAESPDEKANLLASALDDLGDLQQLFPDTPGLAKTLVRFKTISASAALLDEIAPQPISAKVTDIAFAGGVAADGEFVDLGETFAPGMPTIYTLIDFTGMPEGTPWMVRWYKDGEFYTQYIASSWGNAPDGQARVKLEGSPLPPGKYLAEVYAAGNLLGSAEFEVQLGETVAMQPYVSSYFHLSINHPADWLVNEDHSKNGYLYISDPKDPSRYVWYTSFPWEGNENESVLSSLMVLWYGQHPDMQYAQQGQFFLGGLAQADYIPVTYAGADGEPLAAMLTGMVDGSGNAYMLVMQALQEEFDDTYQTIFDPMLRSLEIVTK